MLQLSLLKQARCHALQVHDDTVAYHFAVFARGMLSGHPAGLCCWLHEGHTSIRSGEQRTTMARNKAKVKETLGVRM